MGSVDVSHALPNLSLVSSNCSGIRSKVEVNTVAVVSTVSMAH